MRQIKHPLVDRDLIGIVDHIVEVTQGDVNAALRRLDEADDLIREVAANPTSGMRLSGALDSWLVRHGGRGNRLTVVFRSDLEAEVLYIALVAFGGQDWMSTGPRRTAEDVFGMLKDRGPAKSIEEMDAAVQAEARRQNDRDRRK